jgi:membrane protein
MGSRPPESNQRTEHREVREDVAPTRADYAPGGTDRGTGVWPTLKRTATEFQEDNLSDWAAALTYYGLLSLFPALIALVSVLGLFGDPQTTTTQITDIVSQIGPESAADTFSGPIESITSNQSAAGILFFAGLGVALWSASGYVGAFTRACNVAWETPEGRSFFKLRPLQILITLAMVIMLALVALALVLTGPIVEAVGNSIGVGDTALQIWDIAKWPVLLAVVVLMFSLLYYATPNVKLPGFRFITPGAIFAVVVWLIASALFALYVANFGSYDKTYGTLGGVVTVLVWMWITNLALLFGVELNAERERSRELEARVPRAEREIQLEPRQEPKQPRTT